MPDCWRCLHWTLASVTCKTSSSVTQGIFRVEIPWMLAQIRSHPIYLPRSCIIFLTSSKTLDSMTTNTSKLPHVFHSGLSQAASPSRLHQHSDLVLKHLADISWQQTAQNCHMFLVFLPMSSLRYMHPGWEYFFSLRRLYTVLYCVEVTIPGYAEGAKFIHDWYELCTCQ